MLMFVAAHLPVVWRTPRTEGTCPGRLAGALRNPWYPAYLVALRAYRPTNLPILITTWSMVSMILVTYVLICHLGMSSDTRIKCVHLIRIGRALNNLHSDEKSF